ncbi:MAG: PH domain-containing protein [Vulcanococcus sp.]|uniref:PH domain-containing protein n=1 Tax=Vulcanococcus sp. TaxID=2856995 RepID=UPI0025EF608C|nr:PH domain-containing protein [Vulcanococcus sp.]MBW0166329.1 PH domain-containing protein [Vulcanococcus sp.]
MTGTPKTPPVAPGASINEDVFYAGGPAKGDLITNLLFGLTLIGIPFAVGAIVRALWLRFRITSRRVEVSGGWLGRDRSQVVYSQIREVRSVARGLGFWGDMVLVLNDGTKLEMRAVPHHKNAEAYIEERMAASSASKASNKTGFNKNAAA